MRVLDLFSGIGGMSIGLESVGFRTVAFCEMEPYCRAVLEHHWPGVPIHEDVRTLRGSDVGAVDLVAGGFPCQPVSVAGKRKGQSDARWLWPEMLRIVSELRPRWVLAENVPGLRTLGSDRVLEDLESEGYSCWPLVVGADDVGAPHRRKRVWIVGSLADRRLLQPKESQGADGFGSERPKERRREFVDPGLGASGVAVSSSGTATDQRASSCAAKAGVYPVAHGDSAGRGTERSGGLLDGERQAPRDHADGCGVGPVGEPTGRRLAGPGGSDAGALTAAPALRWPARPGEPQHPWEEPRLVAHSAQPASQRGEPRTDQRNVPDANGTERGAGSAPQPLGGAAHGLPERLVRRANREALRALGNAVVPAVVAEIGRAILAAEAEAMTRDAA